MLGTRPHVRRPTNHGAATGQDVVRIVYMRPVHTSVMRNTACCPSRDNVARPQFFIANYLAIQRSGWRDIKFAFCFLFVCTVEDISTQDGAISVKFWLRVEQTPGTGTR